MLPTETHFGAQQRRRHGRWQLEMWIRSLSRGSPMVAPISAANPVRFSGVFPRVEPADGNFDLHDFLTTAEALSNYHSVEEASEKAGVEINRAISRGYAVWFTNWTQVRQRYGDILVSKLACITKPRSDGTEKARLVVDLRRSGYNSCVVVEERIVLPRLKDLVEDVLAWQAGLHPSGAVTFLLADFEDAYHSLGLRDEEVRYLCVKHPLAGYVVYTTVVFGGAGCTLVWGRAAAFVGRSTQSILDPNVGRLDVYVDDPCVVLAGGETSRRRSATCGLMWWLALGIRISWGKGVYRPQVNWIGASVDAGQPMQVTVAIPPKYVDELINAIFIVREHDPSVGQLQKIAGKLAFAACLVPTLWSQAACIWAAMRDTMRAIETISAQSGRVHKPWLVKTANVSNKKVRHALE